MSRRLIDMKTTSASEGSGDVDESMPRKVPVWRVRGCWALGRAAMIRRRSHPDANSRDLGEVTAAWQQLGWAILDSNQ